MKKIYFVLICALLLVLAGCGANSDTPSATQTNTRHESEPVTDETVPAAVENETADEAVAVSIESPAVFDFYFNGAIISLNQNMAEVLDALGEPLGMRQTPSCAFDGYDRIFGFGAINIHTYPVGDEDFIQIISIRDDSVTTRNGIRLGSAQSKVVEAYGENYEQDFSKYTFTKGNTTLSFFIENDMVVEINYALVMN